MLQGLIIGKFMPLHLGHIRLVEFAVPRCDRLIILVCARGEEPIPGLLRLTWVEETFRHLPGLRVEYTEAELPVSRQFDRRIARIWSAYLARRFPSTGVVFSSEAYGDFLADFMQIRHLAFDPERHLVSVSGKAIREDPVRYWDFLPPPVRLYYRGKGAGADGRDKAGASLGLTATHVPDMRGDEPLRSKILALSVFDDKTQQPGERELQTVLGDSYAFWQELREYLSIKADKVSEEANFAGEKYGWSFHLLCGKRRIIYLIPQQGYFLAALVFGEKAVAAVQASPVRESIKQELLQARKYAEGRGLRLPVREAGMLADLHALIDIKLKN